MSREEETIFCSATCLAKLSTEVPVPLPLDLGKMYEAAIPFIRLLFQRLGGATEAKGQSDLALPAGINLKFMEGH